MKLIFLLLLTGFADAQMPIIPARRDSIPLTPVNPMPTVRPGNDFYRDPNDPSHVVRATLDNIPVNRPDSEVHYTIEQLPGYVPKVRPRKR